jgi:hypothetical protein
VKRHFQHARFRARQAGIRKTLAILIEPHEIYSFWRGTRIRASAKPLST